MTFDEIPATLGILLAKVDALSAKVDALTDTKAGAPPKIGLLTLAQAAAELGVKPDTLRKWVAQGRVAAARTRGATGRLRFDRAELERYREGMARPGDNAASRYREAMQLARPGK